MSTFLDTHLKRHIYSTVSILPGQVLQFGLGEFQALALHVLVWGVGEELMKSDNVPGYLQNTPHKADRRSLQNTKSKSRCLTEQMWCPVSIHNKVLLFLADQYKGTSKASPLFVLVCDMHTFPNSIEVCTNLFPYSSIQLLHDWFCIIWITFYSCFVYSFRKDCCVMLHNGDLFHRVGCFSWGIVSSYVDFGRDQQGEAKQTNAQEEVGQELIILSMTAPYLWIF